MARYNFKVRDECKRILAKSHIDETDQLTACRVVAMALATFAFDRNAPPSMSVELENSFGNPVAVITLLVEMFEQCR
jgi:hypothetical protein